MVSVDFLKNYHANLIGPCWPAGHLLDSNFVLILFELRGAFNKFPDFFVQPFKIVVDSLKTST